MDPTASDLTDPEATRSVGRSHPSELQAEPLLAAGVLYASRYRIIELLGRGGMGEVYRAHDTVLDVAIALKRVGRHQSVDQAQVMREVRLARQITHRSVCRVFDVGVTGDEPYITMEYVDGEDMGSLLRRIGRLPSAKVIEVARQACAGLAAAHAHGILHRDLKPANIMIDRRGDVRITDFGIAVAQGTDMERSLAGTPAYMAPEQLTGQPASPQTDLYSLGLVLYELLTGRAAFTRRDVHGAEAPPSPSSLVSGVDPALERVILQSIDARPDARPASAIAFLATLTGGDVLQAVLDAGQTPSPALVASAGTSGQLARATALWLLLGGVVGVAVIVATAHVRLIDRIPMTAPPEVLADRARTFLREVTGTPPAPYSVSDLQTEGPYLREQARTLGTVDPARVVRMLYRESPEPLVPAMTLNGRTTFAVSLDNPPMNRPGMKALNFDSQGRLIDYRFVPEASALGRGAVDWAPFFRAAGVERSLLEMVEPQGPLRPFGQDRVAWRGRFEGTQDFLRIDAAAMSGVPTWFELRREESAPELTPQNRAVSLATAFVSILLLGAGLWLANYNLRRNGDIAGALRLAAFLFACHLASWLLGTQFLPLEIEFGRFIIAASLLLVVSFAAASFYLALEPFVRKKWPSSLISWNRLLSGRIGDPQVGRDVLVGAVASIVGTALYQVLIGTNLGLRDSPADLPVSVFLGARHLLSNLIDAVPRSLDTGMILVFIYSLIVMLLRRTWAALLVFQVLLAATVALQARPSPLELAVLLIAVGLFAVVFVRFGLLALVSYLFFDTMLGSLPLAVTGDWRTEFATVTIFVAAGILGVSAYSAMRSPASARA